MRHIVLLRGGEGDFTTVMETTPSSSANIDTTRAYIKSFLGFFVFAPEISLDEHVVTFPERIGRINMTKRKIFVLGNALCWFASLIAVVVAAVAVRAERALVVFPCWFLETD